MEKDSKVKDKITKGPMNKGSYQYIRRKKKAYILKVLLYVCIGLFIFLVGLFLNKFQSNNIFTVLAILMVLPGAKALTVLAVFWPFQSVSRERIHKFYEALKASFPDICKEETILYDADAIEDTLNVYFDVVYTSSEKVMNLDVLLVTTTRVLGLQGREKQKLTYLKTYLQDSFKKRGILLGVKMYDNEEAFIKAIKELKQEHSEDISDYKRDRDEAIEFLEASIVK